MSYDYTASVQAFHNARRQVAVLLATNEEDGGEGRRRLLQEAVETIEALSQKCPLTPLLWMQYAATMADYYRQCFSNNCTAAQHIGALQLEYQTLQLGLTEFPGSALMHVRSSVVQVSIFMLQWEEHGIGGTIDIEEQIHGVIDSMKSSIEDVGRGSHRNEDYLVVCLYRLWMVLISIQHQLNKGDANCEAEAKHSVLQRSRTPMRVRNDDLVSDMRRFLDPSFSETLVRELTPLVEGGRRYEAKTFFAFIQYEEKIDLTLQQSGLFSRSLQEFEYYSSRLKAAHESFIVKHIKTWEDLTACWEHLDWDAILSSRDQIYGMGLGTPELAQSFVQYAKAFKNFKAPRLSDDEVDKGEKGGNNFSITEHQLCSLSMSVYERGVAECPCIESLWMSYIRDLISWIQGSSHHRMNERTTRAATERLESVTLRAFRNCPYSTSLLQQKLESLLILAKYNSTILNPKALMDIVQEGLDLGFLPKGPLDLWNLFVLAICLMKRRLMMVLAEAAVSTGGKKKGKKGNALPQMFYDDPELIQKKSTETRISSNGEDLDDALVDEVEDILDLIGELYVEVEGRLSSKALKVHGSSKELCALLWKERAQTEMLLLHPLRRVLEDEDSVIKAASIANPTLQYFEKCANLHNPPHPDSCAMYIHYFALSGSNTVTSPKDVLVHLRQIRGLYAKSVAAVGKGNEDMAHTSASGGVAVKGLPPLRDYDTALFRLCCDWINFEQIFGSPRSLGKATVIIEKKLQKKSHRGVVGHPQMPAAVEVTSPPIAISSDAMIEQSSNDDRSGKRLHGAIESKDDIVMPANKKIKSETSAKDSYPIDFQGATIESKSMDDSSAIHSVDISENHSIATKDKIRHKVRVRNMDYPAHPYTIRVSNLSSEAEDMDLVDAFRPTCGAIVHAKIVREHGTGMSKGWGLIQFEQVESVEKAISLDETLGIQEHLIKVERSHMAAVSLVPPGMHRVRPKGEGKVSKRNQKRQERRSKLLDDVSLEAPPLENSFDKDRPPVNSVPPTTHSLPTSTVTGFRPRTVHSKGRPKTRLQTK